MTHPIRVGIDLTTSARPQTGLETYALSLAEAVLKLGSELRFVVFASSRVPACAQAGSDRVALVESPFGRKVLENQLWLARAVRKHGIDLMHYPAYPPLWPPAQFLLTIHDLTPWHFPRSMSPKGYLYFRSMIRAWAPRSRAILTVSSNVRDEIVRILKIPAERVGVIRPAVRGNLAAYPVTHDSETLRKFSLAPGYVLFVGIIEPRKNLPVLIEAVAKLARQGNAPPLVLAGRPGWGMEQADQAIRRYRLEDKVVFTGHVTDQELAALYRGARFLVQPSIYEGFGLPVLEAMALGCPVIASRIAAHREILGDAGEYFSPSDSDDLVGKMHRLSSADHRLRCSAWGKARAMQFTWQAAAEQVVAVYQTALGSARVTG